MARAHSRLSARTVVLDNQGLSGWCTADQRVTALIREAQDNDVRVIISALTPVKAFDVCLKHDKLRWYVSRLRIEPVTDEIALHAIDLLREAELRQGWMVARQTPA